MKTIETYRKWDKENKALKPQFNGKELPQTIDFLANAYGHLNAIKDKDKLTIPAQQRLAFAMNYLEDALRQMDIEIKGYKI